MQRETAVTQLFYDIQNPGTSEETFSQRSLPWVSTVCMWAGRKFSPIQSVGNTTRATIAPHLFWLPQAKLFLSFRDGGINAQRYPIPSSNIYVAIALASLFDSFLCRASRCDTIQFISSPTLEKKNQSHSLKFCAGFFKPGVIWCAKLSLEHHAFIMEMILCTYVVSQSRLGTYVLCMYVRVVPDRWRFGKKNFSPMLSWVSPPLSDELPLAS